MLESGGFVRGGGPITGKSGNCENDLANRWFQPLTHVSGRDFPRVSAVCCQRGRRGKRGQQRFAAAQPGAQYGRGLFLLAT